MFNQQNYDEIIQELPAEVKLVAVSKTKPISDILEAYKAGHRIFGENKVQEMVTSHHPNTSAKGPDPVIPAFP